MYRLQHLDDVTIARQLRTQKRQALLLGLSCNIA
jgi:hypothetical protein